MASRDALGAAAAVRSVLEYWFHPGCRGPRSGDLGRSGRDPCVSGNQGDLGPSCWFTVRWESGSVLRTWNIHGMDRSIYDYHIIDFPPAVSFAGCFPAAIPIAVLHGFRLIFKTNGRVTWRLSKDQRRLPRVGRLDSDCSATSPGHVCLPIVGIEEVNETHLLVHSTEDGFSAVMAATG